MECIIIPWLPNDISYQCLARIPPFHHPTLSLVSKSFHKAFKSSILHSTRKFPNITQPSLFLALRSHSHLLFYILYSDPFLNKFTIRQLPPIPTHPVGPAFAAHQTKIYVIGASVSDKPSNSVWVLFKISSQATPGLSCMLILATDIRVRNTPMLIKLLNFGFSAIDVNQRSAMLLEALSKIFDCRFNSWESGSKMRVCREFAAAGVADGKIHVMGGCLVDNWARSVYWAESYDPVNESWAALPSPIENRDKWMHASAVVDRKLYVMADRGGVVYDVEKGEWGSVRVGLDSGWRERAATVGGVLYCYDYLGKIRGYDEADDEWKELKGVDKGLPKFLCGAAMADLGGNLCVVWEGKENGKGNKNEMEILCAEIKVGKDGFGVLNGSILWCDVILRVPSKASIVSCFGVQL